MFGKKKVKNLSAPTDTNFEFELGSIVKDKITGFEGVVTHRSQWLNGCNTYGVQPQELDDGKIAEKGHFDEPQLELVEEQVFEPERSTGGPVEKLSQPNR